MLNEIIFYIKMLNEVIFYQKVYIVILVLWVVGVTLSQVICINIRPITNNIVKNPMLKITVICVEFSLFDLLFELFQTGVSFYDDIFVLLIVSSTAQTLYDSDDNFDTVKQAPL